MHSGFAPASVANAAPAGRFCPADYRISPEVFAGPSKAGADILYVVGGLYGNPFALDTIETLFAADQAANPGARCQIVFNGDFHWFDASPALFREIETRTAAHHRQRGNVETELARLDSDAAGCGCAYPESISDLEVQWSNTIIDRLGTAGRQGVGDACIASLMELPMAALWQVGQVRVAVTHGDHESLAGWSLAENQLNSTWLNGLQDFMREYDLNLLASSHTCLPVADFPADGDDHAVINNGSAGMANFRGDTAGIVSRIALDGLSPAPVQPLYTTSMRNVEISALPVYFDIDSWLAAFSSIWPANSAADCSYKTRICNGPDYDLSQAVRGRFRQLSVLPNNQNTAL